MMSATAVTVASVVRLLMSRGIAVDLHNIDSAEVVTARDMFANMVLHSETLDALLFIDSDMSFDPGLIDRMLDLDEDIVGAAYTRRQLDLPTLVAASKAGASMGRALAEASNFNFKAGWDDGPVELTMRDGFCNGVAMGMGCTLIRKRALEAMIEAKAVRPRLDLSTGSGETCWSFFDNLEQDGVRLGEDYSFCYRWTRQMGRELWVCVDQEVGHVGAFEYKARCIEMLEVKSGPA